MSLALINGKVTREAFEEGRGMAGDKHFKAGASRPVEATVHLEVLRPPVLLLKLLDSPPPVLQVSSNPVDAHGCYAYEAK